MNSYIIMFYSIILVLFILYYIFGGHYEAYKRCRIKAISSVGFVLLGALSFFYTKNVLSVWMLIGLVLGMIGDISLDLAKCYPNRKDAFFLGGLASFLLGHLAYVYVFMNHVTIWIEIPVYILFAILFVFGLTKLGCRFYDKLIPVGLYGFVILSMLMQAIKYYIYTPSLYGLIIMIAAILFTLSDVILSFLMFQERPHKPSLTQANLTTYYAAQLLLAFSMFIL